MLNEASFARATNPSYKPRGLNAKTSECPGYEPKPNSLGRKAGEAGKGRPLNADKLERQAEEQRLGGPPIKARLDERLFLFFRRTTEDFGGCLSRYSFLIQGT